MGRAQPGSKLQKILPSELTSGYTPGAKGKRLGGGVCGGSLQLFSDLIWSPDDQRPLRRLVVFKLPPVTNQHTFDNRWGGGRLIVIALSDSDLLSHGGCMLRLAIYNSTPPP